MTDSCTFKAPLGASTQSWAQPRLSEKGPTPADPAKAAAEVRRFKLADAGCPAEQKLERTRTAVRAHNEKVGPYIDEVGVKCCANRRSRFIDFIRSRLNAVVRGGAKHRLPSSLDARLVVEDV